MERKFFHHALGINHDLCIGCSHCMQVCPTEALRVRQGKAELYPNRCIDCGECYRVCPVHAIYIEQDDFSHIFDYKHRVALVPAILMGLFPDEINPDEVYSVLLEMGFTEVFEVESSAPILADAINDFMGSPKACRPVISSFCPAVVRLIQVKFPALVENIMLLKSPLDISATFCKKTLMEKGARRDEVGIFYVTPCAAKIAAIKSPVGEDVSEVTGVLNMDLIYNKVLRAIKKKGGHTNPPTHKSFLKGKSVLWSLTNGEAAHIKGRCLAIDGINNAIDFLEKLENEGIEGIDFLEIRACDESCAGGVLASGNRFLTVERLKERSNQPDGCSAETPIAQTIQRHRDYLLSKSTLLPIQPRSMLMLDEDMAKALKKMERVRRLMCFLPGIDCGACGAPSCQALAKDIVQGSAAISHCIFLQKNMEQARKLHPDHAYRIMEKIWGKDRFEKNCNKTPGWRKGDNE